MKRSTSVSIASAAAILGVSSFAAAQSGPQPGYAPPPGYSQPPGYPQPGYAPPPGYSQPPGYPQPGYAPQPGHGVPQPFGIPLPGFGYSAPAPGYGPPPAYNAPPPAPTFFAESMQSRVALQFDWFSSSSSGKPTLNVCTWDLVAQIGFPSRSISLPRC